MRLMILFSIVLSGCYLFPDPDSSLDFYQNYSDWDIQFIPVIEPIRVSTTDRGETWVLSEFGFKIRSLGVSGNFIYGQLNNDPPCDPCYDQWFLFDIHTRLRATYGSQEELAQTLKYFGFEINEIKTCDAYFDQLMNGKPCYWYPAKGLQYPIDTASYLKNTDTVIIRKLQKGPSLTVDQQINTHKTNIYFYHVIIEKGLPDSLFIAIENRDEDIHYYRQIQDKMVLPVHVKAAHFKMTLYMPFETAQRRNIKENIFDSAIIHHSDYMKH